MGRAPSSCPSSQGDGNPDRGSGDPGVGGGPKPVPGKGITEVRQEEWWAGKKRGSAEAGRTERGSCGDAGFCTSLLDEVASLLDIEQ